MMERHDNRITNDGETAQGSSSELKVLHVRKNIELSLWFMLFSSKVNEKQCIVSRTQLCVVWKKCWSVLETS